MAGKLVIYTDGGSRGNPGPAAAAFAIYDEKKQLIAARGIYLGTATNNVAEYQAYVHALTEAKNQKASEIALFSDSELIVKQINGQYRVKNANLKPIYAQCMDLLDNFSKWTVSHVYRESNKLADSLVNESLDAKKDIDKSPKPAKTASVKKKKPLKIAILLSGSGRTMLNIDQQIKDGSLNAQIVQVISSRSTVKGVDRAKDLNLPLEIVRKKDHPDLKSFSAKLAEILKQSGAELVVQAGWLCLWQIPDFLENRVMNIHPALLPSFGGQGMWGHHVHEAVLEHGCKVSGCTVHFCTNEYDKGPILVQRTCPVAEDDTPDTLAARVFEQECIAYPHAIDLFEKNRIKIQDSRVHILP